MFGFPTFLTIFLFANIHWNGVILQTMCPVSWHEFNGHCYRAVNATSTPNDARAICRAAKADLVSINDKAEEAFVKGLWLERLPNPVDTPAFSRMAIGLNLSRTPNSETLTGIGWTDGSNFTYGNPLVANFTLGTLPWADGKAWNGVVEPKKLSDATCGAMIWNRRSAGQWAATPCDGILINGGFVCEFAPCNCTGTVPGSAILPSNVQCPAPEYTQYNGICYKAFASTTATFPIARNSCRALGGDLASINNEAKQKLVEGLIGTLAPGPVIAPSYTRYFFGLSVERNALGNITSATLADGSALSFGNPLDAGFMPGDYPWSDGSQWGGVIEPKKNPKAFYGFLVKNSQSAGLWAVGPDDVLGGGYVCQIAGKCPEAGMVIRDGYCYRPDEMTTSKPNSESTTSNPNSNMGGTSQNPNSNTGATSPSPNSNNTESTITSSNMNSGGTTSNPNSNPETSRNPNSNTGSTTQNSNAEGTTQNPNSKTGGTTMNPNPNTGGTTSSPNLNTGGTTQNPNSNTESTSPNPNSNTDGTSQTTRNVSSIVTISPNSNTASPNPNLRTTPNPSGTSSTSNPPSNTTPNSNSNTETTTPTQGSTSPNSNSNFGSTDRNTNSNIESTTLNQGITTSNPNSNTTNQSPTSNSNTTSTTPRSTTSRTPSSRVTNATSRNPNSNTASPSPKPTTKTTPRPIKTTTIRKPNRRTTTTTTTPNPYDESCEDGADHSKPDYDKSSNKYNGKDGYGNYGGYGRYSGY